MKIILFCLTLSGCAIVSTSDTYSDGRKTTTTAFELGRTETISGFSDTQTKEGRAINLNSANADVNVKALQVGAGSIGEVVGAALKAYTGKP